MGGVVAGTGSLRSVAGIDIGAAVRHAVAAGHLIKGGGHAMAAGLTVDKGKLDELWPASSRRRWQARRCGSRSGLRFQSTAR